MEDGAHGNRGAEELSRTGRRRVGGGRQLGTAHRPMRLDRDDAGGTTVYSSYRGRAPCQSPRDVGCGFGFWGRSVPDLRKTAITAFLPLAEEGGPKGNTVRHDLHKPEPRAPIPPSPLVGEGAPEGRMRGGRDQKPGDFPLIRPSAPFSHEGRRGPKAILFGTTCISLSPERLSPLLPSWEKVPRSGG